MFGNRLEYEIARTIKFNILRHKDKIQNFIIMIDIENNFAIVTEKDRRKYLRYGFCIVGYFDYIPTQTNLSLQNIINEVFDYGSIK